MSGNVTYGAGVPGDDELNLLGDVAGGRRVIELGIAGNAIALAEAGAKAIALDPDPDRIVVTQRVESLDELSPRRLIEGIPLLGAVDGE